MIFPENFIWGAASSAYQIEGYSMEDGGGKCIWDTFCHTPGKIAWGDNADIACDSYHRAAEDIALLKELGVKAYRFSTSWSRVDPMGDGNYNEKGLAYYDRLVDSLLAAGIEPYMTLYHWELPQALEDLGGWTSVETSKKFGRFAGMMAEHFKGRVKHYFTLNEPQCTVKLGYCTGEHAPGKELDLAGQFAAWKGQLLAHGYAQRAIEAADPGAVVCLASTGRICYPETESAEDIEAARLAMFAVDDNDWLFTHHWFLDPVVLGHFPNCTGTALEPLVNSVTPEEMEIIHTVPKYLGYNIYNGVAVRWNDGPQYVDRYAGFPRTGTKWPVTPEVMQWGVRYLTQRYGLSCFITEDGVSCNDRIYLDGKIHDADRIDFLTRYLMELEKAMNAGCDVKGFFHWCLTDNFEWSNGFGERFGLVFMDFPAGNRIPKDSFYWYQDLIRQK